MCTAISENALVLRAHKGIDLGFHIGADQMNRGGLGLDFDAKFAALPDNRWRIQL